MSRRFTAAAALLALPAAVALSFSAFWRRQPQESEPPGQEASEDDRALLEVVGTYFALRNLRASYQQGDIVVETPEGLKRYPLQGLKDVCQGRRQEQWPQLVGRYFAAPAERDTPLWPDLDGGTPVPRPQEPAPPRIPPIRAPLPEAAPPRREPPPEPPAADVPAREPAQGEPPAPREQEPPPRPGKPPSMAERLAMAARPPAGMRPMKAVRPVRPPAPPEGAEPPVEAEPPAGAEPPVEAEPPAGVEPPVGGEPPAGVEPPVEAGLPAGVEPPVEGEPPAGVEPPVEAGLPAGAEPDEPGEPSPYEPPEESEPPAPPEAAAPGEPAAPPERPAPPKADGAADWAEFCALVEDCFRRHGMEATVEQEGVVARDASGQVQRFQVPGLHRVTHELRRSQWPRFVDAVFADLLLKPRNGDGPGAETPRHGEAPAARPHEGHGAPAASRQEESGPLAGRSLDEVRGQLVVQLYDAGALSAEEREGTIYAEDLPGLLSALAYLEGDEVVRVPPAVVERWGVGAEQVFAAALANLHRVRPPARRLPLAPGVEGLCWQAENEFAAVQALLLNDDPRCNGRFGAAVALPWRGLLVVCPLKPVPNAGDVYPGALTALIQRIVQSQSEGHPLLSRRLYWLLDGRFTDLPYQVQTEGGEPTLELYPPDAFLAALAEMGGEAAP